MEVRDGYAQSAVGLIPGDWACKPLADFLSFISYGFTNPMPTVADGVYMITAADIDHGKLQLASARKTSISSFQKLLTAKSKPRVNDVLLTKDGSLGRLALVGEETICINQSVAVLRANEKVEPNFLKLLLESPWYQTRMLEDAGGSTIKHIYIVVPEKFIFTPALNALRRAWPICRQKSLAIDAQCDPYRWPVAGAKKGRCPF
jgi:type I restriction enzyme S subunit